MNSCSLVWPRFGVRGSGREGREGTPQRQEPAIPFLTREGPHARLGP